MSQTHPEGQQEGLTISNEVLGDVERHLDGQWAGELGAAHHGQDAGADGDQRQRRLVHRALHGTCKAHRGWVGGQKGKLYPGLSQQRQGAPAWEGSVENEDGSSAGICTRQDSHHTLFGTGFRFAGVGRKLAQSSVQTLSLGASPWNHSSHLLCSPAETTITSCQHWLAWQPTVKPWWSRTAFGWLNHHRGQLGGTESPSFTGNGVKLCHTESSRETWLPQKIQLLLLDADWECQLSK